MTRRAEVEAVTLTFRSHLLASNLSTFFSFLGDCQLYLFRVIFTAEAIFCLATGFHSAMCLKFQKEMYFVSILSLI